MGSFNLRRFSNPATLKSIDPELFLEFLSPYRKFFSSRGVSLPDSPGDDEFDYQKLVDVFMTPGSDTPSELAEALYFINEMTTSEGMDALLMGVEQKGIKIENRPDPTPADVAVQVWLQDRNILERQHAESHLLRRRSFEYFVTAKNLIPKPKKPSNKLLTELASDLDIWFDKKKRGQGSKVFAYPKADCIRFLVRHGDPFKREGSIKKGKSSSVFYRPEKYDVLMYDCCWLCICAERIRVNAGKADP